MKHYQCKNQRKIFYIYFVFHILLYGYIGLVFVFDFPGEASKDIGGGIFFLIIALIGIIAPICMEINKRFERTVELNEEGVVYQEKNKTVKLLWDEIVVVSLIWPERYGIYISWNRLVIFSTTREINYWKGIKISDKLIWLEYNNQIVKDIERYWHGAIHSHDRYKKCWREEEKISSSGDYKFKQMFGNDDNRYFRFKIRPNAWIYDEGDYLPNYITNEVYYTRFTTIFGWGENDTLWIYSSDTGIDYWKIVDGRWMKRQPDEGSIELAPERIKEVYLDNRKEEVEM